jgi:hypothetical protein
MTWIGANPSGLGLLRDQSIGEKIDSDIRRGIGDLDAVEHKFGGLRDDDVFGSMENRTLWLGAYNAASGR